MIAKRNCVCLHCKEHIAKGDEVHFLSDKYKIAGEELCPMCVGLRSYRQEQALKGGEI